MNKPLTTQAFSSQSRTQRPNIKEALAKGPRNDKGDPFFQSLDQLAKFLNEEDLCYLVNKALYQLEYQSGFHRKRNEEMKLLRSIAREQKAMVQPSTSPETETENETLPIETPAEPNVVASTQKRSLQSALRTLRKEVDEDLGPSGTFDLEVVPPQSELSEEDEARLNSAFAKVKPQ